MATTHPLDDVEQFLRRFVVYPNEHALVAHTLWVAHTWFMDQWESTPRIAFLSPEPGSGKSRCLEVTEPLVPRPVHAVNTTPAYLFRKVSDAAGLPTILYDEIDTVFGPRAKDNEDVRGMLNAGHRRGAVAGRCVVKGKIVETEELPAYCPVALAGLNDLPDTLMSRSIIVRMRRRAASEKVEPWRHRINTPEGELIAQRLDYWAASEGHRIAWPDIPPGIQDRNADIWEALLAVADLAGESAAVADVADGSDANATKNWPDRARVAAVALVADLSGARESLGVLLLRHLKEIYGDRDRMWTEDILTELHQLPEAPWGDLRGAPIKSRFLSQKLRDYDVHSKDVRIDHTVKKGYYATDLHDPWSRYLTEEPVADPNATSATSGDQSATDDDPRSASEHPFGKLGDFEESPDTETTKGAEPADPGATGVPPHESATSATDATDLPICAAGGVWARCDRSNCAVFQTCILGEETAA